MPTQKQVFCYFWIKVIDEAAQIRDDADRLARAAHGALSSTKSASPVVVNPVTSDRPAEPVVVNPTTSDRPRAPMVVDPTTSDRTRAPAVVDPTTSDRTSTPAVVDPTTSDRASGAVTQWTQDTVGSTSITISTVPQGYVVADPSAAYTTDYIALNQTFNEERARQWIETGEGKHWRGHAKVCVLHHVVVTINA